MAKEIVAPVGKVPGASRDQRASWLQTNLVESLRRFTGYGLMAGCFLYRMDSERYYEELGFNSMREYLVSPEIDMRADVAYRLMRVYKQFCIVGSLELSAISDVSISKLDIAQRYLEDAQADDLVTWARDRTREDLKVYLADKFSGGEPRKRAKRSVVCPSCMHEFVP